MQEILLGYGTETISAAFDARHFEVLSGRGGTVPLTDAEIGARLEDPHGAPPIEELAEGGGGVLIVVPDATRRSASDQIVNLLIRRLIASGTMPYDIAVIFATGIHRPVTASERDKILSPFVAQRTKVIDHRPRDLMGLVRLGETSSGIPVELNRALNDFRLVITVGAVAYHYFAGFTGGRKLVCPGLASSRTIAETHRLAFDFDQRDRAKGVGPGLLEGNPVHEAFIEAASMAQPAFAVNTIVDDKGRATEVVAGHWQTSHLKACSAYSRDHETAIEEKRQVVAVSCGGSPFDLNLIQAHKALETASRACEEGGTILLYAECGDGLGREDFLEWFSSGSSGGLADELVRGYKVNGQTAWSLLKITETFDVRIVTELPKAQVEAMKMRKTGPEEAADILRSAAGGYILPYGSKYLPIGS